MVLGHLPGIKEWETERRGSIISHFPKTQYTLGSPHKERLLKEPCTNHEVDDPEVLLETVTHKLDSNVYEKTKL